VPETRRGDGFFATFDGPPGPLRCARAIRERLTECEMVDGKAGGIAVHTGARVASRAAPGEIPVSSTVKGLVAGSGIGFDDRGLHELKRIPGEWRLYAVTDED